MSAVLLGTVEKFGRRNRTLESATWWDALAVGFFQTLALFPGASRSGTTIAGGMFRVRLDSGLVVLSHLAGKMRKFRIRIVLGDQVRLAVSPYDPSRGRIIYRIK